MKLGTIIKNNWAGSKNPTKYFVYTGVKGEHATGMCVVNGKIETQNYYKRDVLNDRENFEIVGYCDYIEFIKNALENAKRENL